MYMRESVYVGNNNKLEYAMHQYECNTRGTRQYTKSLHYGVCIINAKYTSYTYITTIPISVPSCMAALIVFLRLRKYIDSVSSLVRNISRIN